jgi:hypothetical protein
MLEAIDETCESGELTVVATTTARALTWLGQTEALALLVVRLTDAVEASNDPWQLQATRIGALAATGIAGARELVDRALDTFERGKGSGLAFSGIVPRGLATSASYAGVEIGAALLARLAGRYADATDAFESNSHFCLTVLHLVESLAMAHVDLALANVNVLDPVTQPLLTGFTF